MTFMTLKEFLSVLSRCTSDEAREIVSRFDDGEL